MLRYYESKGSKIISLNDLLPDHIFEAQKHYRGGELETQ